MHTEKDVIKQDAIPFEKPLLASSLQTTGMLQVPLYCLVLPMQNVLWSCMEPFMAKAFYGLSIKHAKFRHLAFCNGTLGQQSRTCLRTWHSCACPAAGPPHTA